MYKDQQFRLKFAASFYQKLLFLMPLLFAINLEAQVAPQLPESFSIEGRVMKNNIAVNGTVDIVFEVIVGSGTCVVFRDTHQEDVTGSATENDGFFNIKLGTGTTQSWGTDLTKIFSNSNGIASPITLNGDGCTVPITTGTKRYVAIKVKKSTDSTFSDLGKVELTSVPSAMVAETLQGYYSSDFFLNTLGTAGQTKLNNFMALDHSNIADLPGVLSGSSSKYVQVNAAGAQIPSLSADPGSAPIGQMWYNTTTNKLVYQSDTGVKVVGDSTSGVQSVSGSSGIIASTTSGAVSIGIGTSGTNGITSAHINDGTIATADIGALQVTNAKLATGIDASKITTGTLPAGVVPAGTDSTKLPLAGGTMTGAITMGGFNLLNVGYITMAAQRTFTLGQYTSTQQSTTLIPSLTGAHAGATWYNSTTGKLMYWNGSAALEVSESSTAGGDITAIITNSGSGLSGGVGTGPATLQVVVDNSTVEIATNTIQVKDAGVALAKLAPNSVDSSKIVDGSIVNADINASAAIAWSKINKTGAAAADVGAVPTTRSISTNTGSGLSGGGNLSADRSLALNVDNSTIEIATNTVQVKDGGITNAKIATVNVSKIVSGVDYFTYTPGGGECSGGGILTWNTVNDRWECGLLPTVITAHSGLTGLTADDHTQYVMLAGRSGGQTINGGTVGSENLILDSTAHATTKGHIFLQPGGGNVSIGTTATPTASLHIVKATNPEIKINPTTGNGAGRIGISVGAGQIANNSLDRSLVVTNDTGAVHIGSGAASPSAVRMTVATSGYVGIGPTDPSNKLVVGDNSLGALTNPASSIAIGSSTTSSVLSLGQSPTARGQIGWFYNATPASAYFSINSVSNPLILQSSGGNVGIGTTVPTATLEVTGQVKITGGSPGSGKYLKSDAAGLASWDTIPASGEVNTASDVGAGGVEVFKQKTGVNLEFRSINSASTKVSTVLDSTNNEVDIDVVEANLSVANMGGILPLSKGGTGTNLTASAGGILYSTASGVGISTVGTANKVLVSGAASAPLWSTVNYPTTAPINSLIYASSANTMDDLAPVNSAVLTTNASGVPTWQTFATARNSILPAQTSMGGKFLTTDGTNASWADIVATSMPLSDLTAATAAATINNGLHAQTWNWNSLLTTTGLTINSTSLTSGTLVSISDTGTAGLATGEALKVSTTNAASSSTPLYVSNGGGGDSFRVDDTAATDTTPFIIDEDGNVGIGTTTTSRKLYVNGNAQMTGLYTTTLTATAAITSDTNITADGTVSGNMVIGGQIVGGAATTATLNASFASSNTVIISGRASAGGTLNITGMTAGGSYTILLADETLAAGAYTMGGQCNGATRGKPTAGVNTTANNQTIITIMYLNGTCYIAWETGW